MLVDTQLPTLVRIRYGCGVQSCHQKLNLQVFSEWGFRELFRNFEKFWVLSGFFWNYFEIFLKYFFGLKFVKIQGLCTGFEMNFL